MDVSIRANGSTITCMDVEFTRGKMVVSMKVSTRMIRSMATAFTIGVMGVGIAATGPEGNSTDLARIWSLRPAKSAVFGKKERGLSGSTQNKRTR